MANSKVYYCKNITSDNLIKMYEILNIPLKGKVGVKISTGEPGGHNFLNPNLIGPLVTKLDGTIIECCTAYGRKRQDPNDHWEAIKNHGFYDIAPCDIMDEFGEFEIEVKDGFHLIKNIVGGHLKNYNSILMLSHYKGHQMAGMGGALKNMSIGIASSKGKLNIHSAGRTINQQDCWTNLPEQDAFLESMADACKAVIDYVGKDNIVYINVLNNLSIDCDCSSNPAAPKMKDIGIMSSTDPVALDKACYDAIMNSTDMGKNDLVNRMLDKHALHIVEASYEHNLGNISYEIIEIND